MEVPAARVPETQNTTAERSRKNELEIQARLVQSHMEARRLKDKGNASCRSWM